MSNEFRLGDIPNYYTAPTNRLNGRKVVYYGDVAYLEFPIEPRIKVSTGETIYKVQAGEEGRLDLIAARAYGDTSLWWIIADANNIFNPFTEMYAGMPLRIVPVERVVGRRPLQNGRA